MHNFCLSNVFVLFHLICRIISTDISWKVLKNYAKHCFIMNWLYKYGGLIPLDEKPKLLSIYSHYAVSASVTLIHSKFIKVLTVAKYWYETAQHIGYRFRFAIITIHCTLIQFTIWQSIICKPANQDTRVQAEEGQAGTRVVV